jgi:DNA-binding HxlR family transcriptional regulator
MRHSELRRAMCDISQKMLTQTLRTLEQNGIVRRTVYAVVPPQVEYALTPLGKSLLEVLNLVYSWAKEHQDEAEQARQAFAVARAGDKT